MKKELIAELDPKSPISEIFRTLRTNIQFMNTKGKLKTILVTSTFPGEGKSWVTSNLAVTFAQAGKKVVLIDADMRKGRQYSIFGVSPIPGLSNYLSGIGIEENDDENEELDIVDFVQETEVDNLFIIPAGNIPPNPSELLITPHMVDLLEQLKELCDIVILDGTPNELVTDSLILTRLVDSTIIVTASKETKKENLKRAIINIQNVGGKIAGVVVNKVPIASKKYEQSYYYGSTELKKTKSDMRKAVINSHSKLIKNNQNTKLANEKMNTENRNNKTKEIQANKENSPKTEVQENNNGKGLERNLKISKENEEISLDKTNDILKQINDYLDKEKKNLE